MLIARLEAALLLLWGLVAINALANTVYLVWVARRQRVPTTWPRLSVLIPARNEAANLTRLLPSLAAQDYPDLELVVYDDASTDDTAGVAARLGGPRCTVLRGDGPPAGWLGKPHACHRAADAATGDLLLFLDADTEWLHEGAVRRFVTRYLGLPSPAVLTALPRFRGGGLLLVSVLEAALLFVPLPLAAWLKRPAFGALNGQCWLTDADRYRRLTPHARFRDAIVEDIEIGRWLLGQGIVPWAHAAGQELAVYMYDSLGDAWRGFQKNFYFIAGGSPLRFVVTWTGILLFLVVGPLTSVWVLACLLVAKFILDRAAGLPWWLWVLAPLTGVLALGVYLDSMIRYRRGKLVWKGRQVSTA